MFRFLLPSLALALTVSAHAEKLTDAHIDMLRANFSIGCHNTAALITPAWLQQGDAEKVCGCSDGKTVTRLKEADFADVNNLTKADQRRIDDIGTNAANECMQPFFAKGVERMAARQCVNNAATIPALQSLAADRVKDACTCAAAHYATRADLHDIDQVAAPDSMLMQHIGELLKSDLGACTAH